MTESDNVYMFTRTAQMYSEGTWSWTVNCDHPNYNELEVSDTVLVTSCATPIPEFSTIGIILMLIIVAVGTAYIRKAKNKKIKKKR